MNTPETIDQQMNIVIVGHVDHGKSTLIGRLLADTDSLPEGKLEQVKAMCERNAKPFEYAFLLDALKDEQSQGITIDTARCFFKSKKRSYIIIDAPGHIEFLKNMITGAARAEAALLLIDAKEGIKENSKRHGFMLSLLGIKQIVVLVNKMDLVDFDEAVFNQVVADYSVFLKNIQVNPIAFIPIAARDGENLVGPSAKTPWYKGLSVLDQIDQFNKEAHKQNQPFRFPVQDIYKFTQQNDDRRIVAGTIQTGSISAGDEVIFYPSKKTSTIHKIEGFNVAEQSALASGHATGFTLKTQIYIKPGELMCKASDPAPLVTSAFKASLFWLGKTPMNPNKTYKLKLGTARTSVRLKEILSVMDASELSRHKKNEIDRHEVAECVFQTLKPVAFDLASSIEETGRFVIVDDYEIAGGGIITQAFEENHSNTQALLERRGKALERSHISSFERSQKAGQKPQLIVLTSAENVNLVELAKSLEAAFFKANKQVYFVGLTHHSDMEASERETFIQHLGETAHLFTDAGMILISTVYQLDDGEADLLKTLNTPHDMTTIVIGENPLGQFQVDLQLEAGLSHDTSVQQITEFLQKKDVFIEYFL
jgi:bifunctional enzyme CysN/CysC